MNKFKLLCSAIVVFAVFGCATPYQEKGIRGGYADFQLQDNVFQISFRGNALISPTEAQAYALRRAAEVTLQHGFDYFTIQDQSTTEKQSYMINGNTVNNVSKPEAVIIIKCGTGKSPDSGNSYNAQELLKYSRKI